MVLIQVCVCGSTNEATAMAIDVGGRALVSSPAGDVGVGAQDRGGKGSA